MSTREIWAAWEDVAERYLVRHGYSVLEKNWTIPGGELDLVAEQCGIVVFVEVKLRSHTRLGHARESLSTLKRRHLRRSGMLYAVKHGLREDRIRFDFIAIQKGPTGWHVEHFCNIEV